MIFWKQCLWKANICWKNGDISQFNGVDIDTMQNMSIDVIKNQDRDFSLDAKKKTCATWLKFLWTIQIFNRR